ncbi:threonine--tRNA ligase 1, cytoplasmic-like [Oppia nitens]|uniref:threonine--tRNA ligase 1, cytoplasmic-like n=1 Tax=Oppia nitens TaxID=1686743 RepID=UPI0023DC6660|nr:threonine--tRNA ligase 1, cytoplasmic-like [Oppia nitens]
MVLIKFNLFKHIISYKTLAKTSFKDIHLNHNSFTYYKTHKRPRLTTMSGDNTSVDTISESLKDVNLKELSPQPDFIDKRIQLWDKYKQRYLKELSEKTNEKIKVTVKDKNGDIKEVEILNIKEKSGEVRQENVLSWKTSPIDVAKQVGPKSWTDSLVIAKVNGVLWDLERPLESNSNIELLTFNDDEGRQVFWHSSAHMLGEAVERLYGCHLCYGPPIENGYYYDAFMCGTGAAESEANDLNAISMSHFNTIESVMKTITNESQPFERLELTKDELIEMFSYNKFKVRILKDKIKEERTTVYRCGTLIDLCRGPHVRHTGNVKAFKVTKSSSAYWEGKAEAESLQRVYGISFPDQKQLKEWQKFQEEAAKRDHRKLGREQGLYFFHELSPGSCFFTPKGAHIYNTLLDLIRSEYRKRGFQEVISPNVYNFKLWHISGHGDHYADNMFLFDVDKEKFGLKPMNCPGHCLIFDSEVRSWRELPLRLADFGVLHRNELSGALSGLTRVRRFQQDDAHIFCTVDQISQEIKGALDFLKYIYSIFGFTFDLCLSTRPESFLGEIEVWNSAEDALAKALDEAELKWKLNPGDGAFYGPKIDITINDALRRPFQCATIQLDFQLPLRFNLNYNAEDGIKKKPVIIHRAILGSIERFIAIITENFAGKWPFWISPRQAIVLPIGSSHNEYAETVRKQLFSAGFQVDSELDPGQTINKKVRNAQLAQYNFILVVGDKEMGNNSVNVRTRDNKQHGECSLDQLIVKFNKFKESKILNSEEVFNQ